MHGPSSDDWLLGGVRRFSRQFVRPEIAIWLLYELNQQMFTKGEVLHALSLCRSTAESLPGMRSLRGFHVQYPSYSTCSREWIGGDNAWYLFQICVWIPEVWKETGRGEERRRGGSGRGRDFYTGLPFRSTQRGKKWGKVGSVKWEMLRRRRKPVKVVVTLYSLRDLSI